MSQDDRKQEVAKPTNDSAAKTEPKKREERRRTDTLTDDNPLICRGID